MTEPTSKTTPGVKTLGVKLPDGLHSQFSLVAQLNGLSLNDAVLEAVKAYVEQNRSQKDFAERAAAVVAEIEREAEARRGAIQALFGEEGPAASETTGESRRRAKE
jgi:metal-responsive CopG/Arc/MetJ family transcriptional regulator